MGTRRSKHNKGRKPFYKEFGRETTRRFVFKDDKLPREKPRLIPIARRVRHEASAEPGLADEVAAYLEKRHAEHACRNAAPIVPTLMRGAEHQLRDMVNPHLVDDNPDLIQSSERDVLLQLFVERKIGAGQLHAGRRWQSMRERATLQPNACILARAWSRRIYQVRGNISDAQVDAMAYRRDFIAYAGPAALAFLDFCLDADRGADDLTRLLDVSRGQLVAVIDDLLSKLCTNKSEQRAAA